MVWNCAYENGIYVAICKLSSLHCLQGGLFAGDSPYYLWLVPTLAHSITVSIINMLYSKVAEKCTDLENHRCIQA